MLYEKKGRHRVSVICMCYQEARYIGACLDSLLAQDYPLDFLEIIVVDGMSTDGTQDIVRDYASHHSHIQVLTNPQRTAPYAMNLGIRTSRGDTICWVGAHSTYPPNYVSYLTEQLYSLEASCVGPILRTKPGVKGSVEAEAVVQLCPLS